MTEQITTVFFISDGTAITAEHFGNALLSQFDITVESITVPFVETEEKAKETAQRINQNYQKTQRRPIVFHSIINPTIRQIIENSDGYCHDFINTFVTPLETQLGVKSIPASHQLHSLVDVNQYESRISAINFAIDNDDGKTFKNLQQSDLILLGVSRCGKTPTSLYLSMQFGFKVANYPFIDQDMEGLKLPPELRRFQKKLVGLTISPKRLHEIRQVRRSNSRYASINQCRIEVQAVERLYQREKIPVINTTYYSVEEISTKIIDMFGLKRQLQ